MLRFAPDGAQPGETIWLRVTKGRLKIGEETMPGKHKEV
jgi:hypothetical protein